MPTISLRVLGGVTRIIDLGDKGKVSDVNVVRALTQLGYYVTTDPSEQATPRHKVSVYSNATRVRYVAGSSKLDKWDMLLAYILEFDMKVAKS